MTATEPRHLLVIGAQRSGSTYLGAALDAHPQITMARPAAPEPKVFCDPAKAARGREWYLRTWFAHAGDERLLGDKSTSYLEDPGAPARAAHVLGEVQVVAVLRDPVQRAVSHWRFSTQHGLETAPLEEALLADLGDGRPWDRTATSVSPFAYLRRGRYVDYLTPWFATFPDTTHVLFLEELVAGTTVLTDLFHDLGVDPGPAPAPPGDPVNGSEVAAPVMSEALLGTLSTYFARSNSDLAARLGRTLPW